MRRVVIAAVVAILWGSSVDRAIAELKNEDLERAIKATVLVELPNGAGFGTAFCINSDGYFVTNRHVVDGIRAGGKLTIVLSSGGPGEAAVEATVVKVAEKDDLALLRAPKAAKTSALELGDSSKLHETMPITAFGYPYGKLLGVEKQKYPNISVNVGRVTALRGDRTSPTYIQTDAQLNPGNSGGPMLDESGRVIGVVFAGVHGSGIALVIPVDKVKLLLNEPQIDFGEIDIPYASRYKPLNLKIAARPVIPGAPAVVAVKVRIQRENDKADVSATRGDDGYFHASIAPLDEPKGPPQYGVEIEYPDGSIRGTVADRIIKIGDKAMKLSKLQGFSRVESGVDAVQEDGTKFSGRLEDPKSLTVQLAGRELEAGLDTALHVDFASPSTDLPHLTLAVYAKTQDGQVFNRKQTLAIGEPPAAVARSRTRPIKVARAAGKEEPKESADTPPAPETRGPVVVAPPKLGDEPLEIELPFPFDKVVCGGGGRFLIFHIPSKKSLAVLDISQGQIVKELPVSSDQILLAAGRKKLMVVLPGERLIQRWDLQTLAPERMATVPTAKTPLNIYLGSDSDGPLWIWSGGGLEAFSIPRMQTQPIKGDVLGCGDPQYGFTVLFSADGSTATSWENGLSSPPYGLMHVIGSKATHMNSPFGEGYNGRWMWPNADGSLILGHGARVFDSKFKQITADWLKGGNLLPTIDRRYFLLVKPEGKGKSNVSICTSNDRRIVYTLTEIENVTPEESNLEWGRIKSEPRVYFIPSASVLVTLPAGDDRVLLRRLNLAEKVKGQERSDLYVDSSAPAEAHRGQMFRYQIVAHGNGQGKLTYHLESGPRGMTVGADGLVTWSIPSRYKEEQVSAVVSIRDDAGNEALHTISFYLTDQ